MDSKSFARSLRAFTRRAPFVAFSVELMSGRRITVDHPKMLVVRGGLAVHVAPDGTPALHDRTGVTRLAGTPDSQSGTV